MHHRDPRSATGTQPAELPILCPANDNGRAIRRDAAERYAQAHGPAMLAELARAVVGRDGMRLRPRVLDARLDAVMFAAVSRLRDYGVEIPPIVLEYLLSIDDDDLALMAMHVVHLDDDEVGVDFCHGLDWLAEMRRETRGSCGEPS